MAAPPVRGLYVAEQATAGAQLYAIRCAMCHGARLEGTYEVPGLTGKFVANWGGRPLGDLSAYVGRAMPQFAPGTLSAEDNAKIVAFILQRNGYPAAPAGTPPGGLRGDAVLPAPPPPR
ncbi:c-type cytochrome [Novosphingobium piscinae]|uniref:Cytochrome c n=1 Tax=Novosphingobium piscinae TaxID=1507448 RepID=A0A7X1KQG7_9SPHN|nr:cytochrome c [Novosphingobium piscinae]